MQKRELAVGDRVWVYLPYDGGRGYATILDLNAEPIGQRKTATIRVRFEPGQLAYRERLIRPKDVIRKVDEPAESNR